MTAGKAIQLLRAMQDPGPYDPQITEDAFTALDMAIDVLKKQQISETIKQEKQNQLVEELPSEPYVSFGVYQQVAWERDVATEQLRELGYSLGEKIITCKNCEYWGKRQGRWYCFEMYFDQEDPNFYCGYAKEKEEVDECQDCEAYECYKNGIHAKCPRTGFFDDCARAEREDNEAWGRGESE